MNLLQIGTLLMSTDGTI